MEIEANLRAKALLERDVERSLGTPPAKRAPNPGGPPKAGLDVLELELETAEFSLDLAAADDFTSGRLVLASRAATEGKDGLELAGAERSFMLTFLSLAPFWIELRRSPRSTDFGGAARTTGGGGGGGGPGGGGGGGGIIACC